MKDTFLVCSRPGIAGICASSRLRVSTNWPRLDVKALRRRFPCGGVRPASGQKAMKRTCRIRQSQPLPARQTENVQSIAAHVYADDPAPCGLIHALSLLLRGPRRPHSTDRDNEARRCWLANTGGHATNLRHKTPPRQPRRLTGAIWQTEDTEGLASSRLVGPSDGHHSWPPARSSGSHRSSRG